MDTAIVVDVTRVTPNGTLEVRFTKVETENGVVVKRQFHRTTLPPGVPWEAQMAEVTKSLAFLGWPAVALQDTVRAQTIANQAHTPAVITEYRRQKAAADALVRVF